MKKLIVLIALLIAAPSFASDKSKFQSLVKKYDTQLVPGKIKPRSLCYCRETGSYLNSVGFVTMAADQESAIEVVVCRFLFTRWN